VPNLNSLLPFRQPPVSGGGEARTAQPAKREDFGKASSFELLFDRLMDDPETSRDRLFSTRICRQ
jgi:hypothetical protein